MAEATTADQLDQFEFPVDPDSNPEPQPEALPAAKTPEVPKPADKPKHPAYLVKAAKQAGIDDADIAELSSDELKSAISILAQSRQQDRQIDDNSAWVRQQTQADKKTDQPEPEFSLADIGIDPSKWDADIDTPTILTQVVKPLVQELKILKSQFEQLQTRDRNREMNTQHDQLDQLFNQRENVFGKGSRFKLDQKSPEYFRRLATLATMKQISQANKALSMEEVFERASEVLYGPNQPAPEVEIPHRNGTTTIKPTPRATKASPKGTAAAVAAVEQVLKERGVGVGPNETSEHDELPD